MNHHLPAGGSRPDPLPEPPPLHLWLHEAATRWPERPALVHVDGDTLDYRALAAAVADASLLRFDLSDLTPQAFGGGSSAHMWVLLQNFLADEMSPIEVAQRLEDAASRDFKDNG